jgi:hypothetical protein
VTPTGETAASIESVLAVAASNLLQISAPIADNQAVATGWNVYIGTASFGETLQNATPLALGTAFTLPTTGLATGRGLPNYILAVENWPLAPVPLAEGIDFQSDYDAGLQSQSKGWLTRLFPIDASPRRWTSIPILVQYQAGYAPIPDDLQDAALELVKAAWFARTRDPMLRAENIEGVLSSQWWFAGGPGSETGLPPKVESMIDQYRIPVIA